MHKPLSLEVTKLILQNSLKIVYLGSMEAVSSQN